jgi:hypothetical protein
MLSVKKTGKSHWIVKQGYRVEESTLCIFQNKFTFFAADGYVHAIEQATINREEKENHIGN